MTRPIETIGELSGSAAVGLLSPVPGSRKAAHLTDEHHPFYWEIISRAARSAIMQKGDIPNCSVLAGEAHVKSETR
jgi:hypothetical protein